MNKYKINVILITLFTILTLLSNFLFYRVAHIYLNSQEKYGVWLVILSLITWFYVMDLGISNSLRNYLTQAIESKDWKKARQLIFTTYIIMLIPLSILIIFGFIINQIIDWASLLNVVTYKKEVNSLLLISFLMFPVVFYLNTITYIFHSFYKSYLVNLIQFMNLFINCVVLYVMSFSHENDLVLMGIIYFGINILIYFLATILFFNTLQNKSTPIFRFKNYDVSLIRPLLSIGIAFFILDVSSIILYNSGPLLISYFFKAKDSVTFQLPYKLLSIFVTLSYIFLSPLRTLVINELTKHNFNSIKKLNIRIIKLLSVVILLIVISTFFVNYGIFLWIGKNYNIDYLYIFLISTIVSMSIICHTYTTLLNAMGKVSQQIYYFIIAIIISLALMYIFIDILNFGKYGFVISLNLGLMVPTVILPYIFNLYINKEINSH